MQDFARITESPRDAMQGLDYFIPTKDKARYINALLKVGFDIIDFGSFVSPKAIPQFSDVKELLDLIEPEDSNSELLAIVGNAKLGQMASAYDKVHWFGYPFSVSSTFQKMNLNRSREESLDIVEQLLEICDKGSKKFRAYLSMAFGNPYNDPWNSDIVAEWTLKLTQLRVNHISISDTIGLSSPESIQHLFALLINEFPTVEFGLHLHTRKQHLQEKVSAAWEAGCRNFDSVLGGVGGCPLSGYELVGNLDTLELLSFLKLNNITHALNKQELDKAIALTETVFSPGTPLGSFEK